MFTQLYPRIDWISQMAKIIFTDHDIEQISAEGKTSLKLSEDMVLTDLAYEKAKLLGIELQQSENDQPPSAPIRPYLNSSTIIPDLPKLLNSLETAFQSHSIKTSNTGHHDILDFSPLTSEQELREAIIQTGQILYKSGLMVSNDGNISVRMADGNILITPSGVTKGRISTEDLVIISLDGNIVKPASNPALKPTSEQPMHLEIYRQRPDVRAVIHTHLIFANALAISHGKVRMDVIPEAAIAFGDVPVTDFALPSSNQNAEAIRNLIKKHDVMLIRNHGSLAVGKNLDEALINTERLEHVSKTLTFAELLGQVNTLPEEMLQIIGDMVQRSKERKS
jgi:L-fuculose-phosphate aldolase